MSTELTLRGPALWRELHLYAMLADLRGTTAAEFAGWLARWESTLPDPECDCWRHYHEWRRCHDTWLGRGRYLEWTVALHNDVNRRRGVRPWTYSEADRHYAQLLLDLLTLQGWIRP